MTLKNAIAAYEGEMLKSLQESIHIPSVQTAPLEGAPYGEGIALALEHALGTAARLGMRTENMAGQAGWCEFGEGEEMIAILGHLDVVPAGDGWSFDPFGGEIKDGKIFGRGTMDDKGPTIAALYAMAAIKNCGIPLRRRVRLILGTNEETGSKDMVYYLSHGGESPVMGFTPDGEYPVINGEKGIINVSFKKSYTQNAPLCLMRISGGSAPNVVPDRACAELICPPDMADELIKKSCENIHYIKTPRGVSVTADGIGAHGSTPQEGENAIGRLLQALAPLPFDSELSAALRFLADRIGMETGGASLGIGLRDDISGALTLNLGVIEGYEQELSLRINYRYPVTKHYEDCAPILNAEFAAAGFTLEGETHKPSLYVPAGSQLVRTLLEVYHDETGLPAVPKSIGGGTYAKAIPNVVAFGPIFPGDEVREHKPDEFIEVDKLMKNMSIFAEAILRLAK